MNPVEKTKKELHSEIIELRARLMECEDTINAIRTGEVDALVVSTDKGEKIFSLQSIDYSYRIMVESMNEGTITVDKNGIIFFANQALSNLIGRDMSSIVGTPFHDLVSSSQQERFSAFLDECSIHPYREEYSIPNTNGNVTPVSLSGTVFEIAGKQNICIIINDLSERRESELNLQRAFDEVEKKVLERTAELRLSQERLSLAQLAGGIGTFEWDLVKNKVLWTPEMEALYGLSQGDFGGTIADWENLIHKEDREKINEKVEKGIKKCEGPPLEFRIIRPDESIRWIETASKILCDQGSPVRMIGINKDITERKEAELALRESEQHFRLLFQTMLQGVVYQDAEGKVISMNPAAEYILGKTPEEFINSTSAQVEHHTIRENGSPFPGLEHPAIVSLRTGEKIHNVIMGVYNPRMQSYRWINIDAVPLFREQESKPYQVYTLFSDITERKSMVENLRQWANELAASNKELESFSYSVSHDLRSPLRTIKGYCSILMEDYSEKLDAEGENYLGRILSSAEKMSALIDDMLRLAKISRQEMSLKEIDLTAIAWSIVNDLIQNESTRKVEVVIAENLKTNGDERLMNIALSNIIGNAWKYSSKVANPRIEFGMTTKDGKKIYYVRDNGAGFDMKYAEKLFTPFQRLHSDREFSGTGIGLPIVKRVIERHGGIIWATGEPGHGATIYFSLP